MPNTRVPLAAIAVSLVACACSSGELRSNVNEVRDSSGVTIVQSGSPTWTRSTAWYVDTMRPFLVADAEPIERKPLDPVSVFRTETGEIVVADGNQSGWHSLLVYDSRGRWLRTLGRKGQGPCEFQQVWWASPYRGDSIAVFDMGRQLVHILGLGGGCGESVQVPRLLEGQQVQRGTFVNMAYAVYPDGTFLMAPFGGVASTEVEGPSYYVHDLIRVDRSGKVLQVLGKFEISSAYWDGHMMTRPLFYGAFADRVLDAYDLVYGNARSYQVQRFDSVGTLKSIVRRHADPQPVTRSDQERLMSRTYIGGGGERPARPAVERNLDQKIEQAHWAEVKPFYRTILVDEENHIWVEEFRLSNLGFEVAEDEQAVWSVFGRDGAWLGSITLPPQFFIKTVYNDVVYGIWQDEDGVRTVRAYPLMKPS